MVTVFAVRLQKSVGDDVPFETYWYTRVFRTQAKASRFLNEMQLSFRKHDGFTLVDIEQPGEITHSVTLQNDKSGERHKLALCAWDYDTD